MDNKEQPTNEQFCKFHTGYYGEEITDVSQLVHISLSGEELVEYLQAFAVFMSKNKSVPTPEAPQGKVKCDCPCHDGKSIMMHFVPCCDNGWKDSEDTEMKRVLSPEKYKKWKDGQVQAPDKIPSAEPVLFNCSCTQGLIKCTCKSSGVPSAEEYFDKHYPNSYVTQVMESYALLREQRAVEQAKEEFEKISDPYSDYFSLTMDGMKPSEAAKECGLL